MNHPEHPPGAPEFSDSDQQWFDRLRGKPSVVDDARAIAEADALRRLFELEAAAEQADPELNASLMPPEHQRRWEQLQFRLRSEQAKQARLPWYRRGKVLAAMAASVLIAVVLVQQRPDDAAVYDEPPTWRGGIQTTQVMSAQPRQAAESLARRLRDTGLPASLHQHKRVFVVDVEVAPDTPAAALDVLRSSGAQVTPGPHRLEFAPR